MRANTPRRPRRLQAFVVVAITSLALLIAAPFAAAATTTRVSTTSAGAALTDAAHTPDISGDGRYVAMRVDGSNAGIYRKDRTTGTLLRVTPAAPVVTTLLDNDDDDDDDDGDNDGKGHDNGKGKGHYDHGNGNGYGHDEDDDNGGGGGDDTAGYWDPSISADGGRIAFVSDHPSLTAVDTNGSKDDVFVWTASTGLFQIASVGTTQPAGGAVGPPAISADGRYVTFASGDNLLSTPAGGTQVYRRDLTTQSLVRVSTNDGGTAASGGNAIEPRISGDGRYVVFASTASNLVDASQVGVGAMPMQVFRKDLTTGDTMLVSVGTTGKWATGGDSRYPAISADGRYVAFQSMATNLTADGNPGGHWQVYVRDLQAGTVSFLRLSRAGTTAANGDSVLPRISGDGTVVAFASDATNLVTGDTNGRRDVFTATRAGGAPERVSVRSDGTQADDHSAQEPGSVSIDSGGVRVAYSSKASNLDTLGTGHLLAAYVTAFGDVTAPNWPSGAALTFSNIGTTGMTVHWPAATDTGGGVKDYVVEVYLAATPLGSPLQTLVTTALSQAVTGLSPSTLYTFKVRPRDFAGNVGADLVGSQATLAAGGGGGGGATPTPTPDTGSAGVRDVGVVRIGGTTRAVTAADLARRSFAPGVPVTFVATTRDYADALAAGPAAALLKGPVLLTQQDHLLTATADVLHYLKPKQIVVVGGQAAVASSVLDELRPYTTGTVRRIWGQERIATAAEISEAYFAANAVKVHVAPAYRYADALSGGAAAGFARGPLLLAGDMMTPELLAELRRLDAEELVVLGGTAGVSAAIEDALERYADRSVRRIAGATRYETAALVAATFPATTTSVLLARGDNWPDALAGVAVAGVMNAPLLLTPSDRLHPAVIDQLQRIRPDRVVLLGGESALEPVVALAVSRYLAPVG